MTNSKWMTGLLVAVLCFGTSTALAGTNDDCANASVIMLGDTAFDTSNATTDGPEHVGSDCDAASDANVNQDIWYNFTSDCAGTLVLSTCSTADYDTRIAIYEGCDCPVGDANLLGCNDDSDGCDNFTSLLEVPVVADACYKIRVGGYGENVGTGTLNLTCIEDIEACVDGTGDCFAPHANGGCEDAGCCETVCTADMYCCDNEWDASCVQYAEQLCGTGAYNDCDEAYVVPSLPHTAVGNNIGMSIDCTGTGDAIGEAWMQFTLDVPMNVTFSYCGTDPVFDTVSAVLYGDCPCDEENAIFYSTGDFTTCADGNATLSFNGVPSGTWYYPILEVEGAQGNYNIEITGVELNGPANDLCGDAIVIYDGDTAFDNTDAITDGPAHPDHESCDAYDDDNVNQDIWYTYTATCTGDLTVSTCGTADFDTRIAIYDTCDCPAAAGDLVDCNDDGTDCAGYTSLLEAPVAEGECYLIRIGGYGAGMGTGTVNIQCGESIGACCNGFDCVGTMGEAACDGIWYAGEDCDTFECPACEICDTCYTNTTDDYITNVTFGDIDSNTGQDGACSYYDGTAMSTEVAAGESYPFSMTFFSDGQWTECGKVYVDWNHDCVMSEDEATYLDCGVDATLTGTIDVPADAMPGCTTMRVIEEYDDEPAGACNTASPTNYGEAEDYTVCVIGGGSVALTASNPAMDSSLWRNMNNHIELTFDGDVPALTAGAITIQELLPGGSFGPDLSADFTMVADGAMVMIDEDGSALTHGHWYGIRNTGAWAGVDEFAVHMLLAIGDAGADGLVLPNDLSLINSGIPSFDEPATSRFDINGDGMALPNDLSIANSYIPSFAVPKPAGH